MYCYLPGGSGADIFKKKRKRWKRKKRKQKGKKKENDKTEMKIIYFSFFSAICERAIFMHGRLLLCANEIWRVKKNPFSYKKKILVCFSYQSFLNSLSFSVRVYFYLIFFAILFHNDWLSSFVIILRKSFVPTNTSITTSYGNKRAD